MNEKDDINDEIIEMENIKENDTIITQENKPYNLSSTSNDIQNIFKKIREKNKEIEFQKGFNDLSNKEFKEIPFNNEQDNNLSIKNINLKTIIEIIIILLAFICFYFSFIPISNYFIQLNYFIFPMDLFSFILCTLSSLITAGIISFVIIRKMSEFYILLMICYYIIIFFLNHYKYIGNSHFDQSLSVFCIFISVLIHSLCIFFIYYFLLKNFFLEGYINKKNFFIRPFVSRWLSSEKGIKKENSLKENNQNILLNNRKGNKIKLYLIIFSFLSIQISNFLIIKFKKEQIFTCDNWEIGINGTKINSGEDNCQIPKPKGYCYMDYFKGYFELSKNEDKICSLRDSTLEKENFLKNINKKNKNVNLKTTNIFAFPLTNSDKKYSLQKLKNFGRQVNKDIYDFERNINRERKPEAILDFSESNKYKGKYAELRINVNFNKDLSEERKLLENENSLFNNVFIINLQSTSRTHFQRSFPKLSNFIKSFMKYNPLTDKKIEAFQFMKYHSFSEYSENNILPMYYGSSLKSKKGTNHIKYFKENGFITGHEIDSCQKELSPIYNKKKDKKEYEEWDHENIAYLCDGNSLEIENELSDNGGASYFKERCLYGNHVSYYMINYAKQFWEKYSENKKYFRMGFNNGYEKTGYVISYLDEVLYNFIFEFYDKRYFDNTALFIVSDHGNQKNRIYNILSNIEYEMEKKMGIFILLINGNSKKYEKNLLNNQHIFLTPYDIHDTLIHIIYGDNNDQLKNKNSVEKKGNSVLLEMMNEKDKKWKKYDDWIDDNFCCCLYNKKKY